MQWKLYNKRYLVADVSKLVPGSIGISDVVINGGRMPLARYPNLKSVADMRGLRSEFLIADAQGRRKFKDRVMSTRVNKGNKFVSPFI